MKQIKFKKNRLRGIIFTIQLYFFKLKIRNKGISIWDKTLKELINKVNLDLELQNNIIDGKITCNEVIAIVFNQRKYSNKKNLKQQIHIGNHALLKVSNQFSLPLKDKNIELILLFIKQELLNK